MAENQIKSYVKVLSPFNRGLFYFLKNKFGNTKTLFYFYTMTTIKISDKAHKDLKVFSAKAQYNMSVIASDAILQYIKEQKSKPKSNATR